MGQMLVVRDAGSAIDAVPAGYRATASRDGVAGDGIEHENLPIFSVQFHPEARGDFAVSAGFPPASIDDELRRDSGAFLDAFVAFATRGATSAPSPRSGSSSPASR